MLYDDDHMYSNEDGSNSDENIKDFTNVVGYDTLPLEDKLAVKLYADQLEKTEIERLKRDCMELFICNRVACNLANNLIKQQDEMKKMFSDMLAMNATAIIVEY